MKLVKAIGVLVGVAGMGGAVTVATVGLGGRPEGTATADRPPATAEVTRQTIRDTKSVDGDLGHGPSVTLSNRLSGTVTSVPLSGAVVRRGQALYRLNNGPVVLMYGPVPAYRPLGPGDSGADVRELEQNLKALGYRGFTVDDDYTGSTADAVQRWQEDLGLDETGRVELGRVQFAPAAVRVETVSAQPGEPLPPGGKVLTYTGTVRLVTVRLDATDQRLAKQGAKVSVTMPNGTTAAGVITQVDTLIVAGATQDADPTTKVETIVALTDPKAGEGFDEAAVDVVFTADERPDVLTVPIAALVALDGGGYGLEVVDGTTSRYLRVATGLFADGRVEVSGDGLAEGMTVGIPR
jgi:peptidoglycan hydrolase-like protein with peptidoglycan-binding domain